MSHWFSVRTKLNSENAIRETAKKMGFMVLHNKDCRGYNGQKTNCDLVMKLPGEYDIGFQKQADGSYEIKADFWIDYISKYLSDPEILRKAEAVFNEKVGSKEWSYDDGNSYLNEAKISKFMNIYSCESTKELIKRQGLQYIETVQKDGSVVLETVGQGEGKTVTTITPNGKIRVEAEGYTGNTCSEATAFLRKLGISENEEMKPEYYNNEAPLLREGQ